MHPIFQGIVESLNEFGFEYESHENDDYINFSYKGSSGIWNCKCLVLPEAYQLIIYSEYPFSYNDASEKRLEKYAHLVNFNLPIGLVEMDYSAKVISFKIGHDFSKSEINVNQIHHLIGMNLALANCYFSGISQVMAADRNIEDIIQSVEDMQFNKGEI